MAWRSLNNAGLDDAIKSIRVFGKIVDNLDVGVVLIGKKMELLALNDQMRKWFPQIKKCKNHLCYQTFDCPPKKERCNICPTLKTFKDGKAHELFADRVRQGGLVKYRIVSLPVKNGVGKIIAALEMLEDITAREKAKSDLELQAWGLKKANEGIRLLYKELESRNEELQKLDQLKSDFVSTVSHELKTPLSIVKEGISLMRDGVIGDINEKQVRMLDITSNNIDRLSRIISDLLDVSRIEFGKMQLRREMVDLRELVKQVAVSFEPKLNKVKIQLAIPLAKVMVFADPGKLTQVFLNLIGNAIKFTDKGHIEVGFIENPREIECCVADTGSGIDKKDLPKVFGKFEQFGRVDGAGEKGTGLGLSIVKGIVEIHHGKIWVESEVGKGSRFIFTIPKYSSDEVFRKRLESFVEDNLKEHHQTSIISIALRDLGSPKKNVDGKILKAAEGVMFNNLRSEKDFTLMGHGIIAVALDDCGKHAALRVGERLIKNLREHLVSNTLTKKIRVDFVVKTSPDDGVNFEKLVKIK